MLENDKNKEAWQILTNHHKIGEILLQHKKITIDQLSMVLDRQKIENQPLGEILISMNIIGKNELIEVLELQSRIDKIVDDSYSEIQNLKVE
jgi:hypothetical protein